MTLKTRKPTGLPSHPCILIEGDEKSGKSWMAAEFTGDERFGAAYWIDLAEGDGEQYGKIPGARYEIAEHDGTYVGIHQAIVDVHAEAKRAHDAGEKPVVLVIDPIGALWALLSDWAYNRASTSNSNKKLLTEDPNADINIGPNYWNPATERWRKVMTLLLTFPGVVLLLARGKETAVIGSNGNPVAGKKDYRVEGHKTLCHDVTVWVRLTRSEPPRIIGGRSTRIDMRPGKYRPETARDFSLGWLLFDALGYDPATARVREGMEMHAGSDAPQSEMASVIELAVETAENEEQLKAAWLKVDPAAKDNVITEAEAAKLSALVKARKLQLTAPPEVNGHASALVGAAK